MSPRCKCCLAVIGLCLASCKAADSHDHAGENVASTENQPLADFVTYLADESPAEHVQHLYNASGATESLIAWMLDASSQAACGEAAEDSHDGHAGHDSHEGHAHRRLLQDTHNHDDHAEDHDHSGHGDDHVVGVSRASLEDHDHDHDHDHDEHRDDHVAEVTGQRVLTAEALENIWGASNRSEQAVTEALAYVTTCLVDSSCVLEGRGADAEEDAHSGAGDHVGLKLGLAFGFFLLTVLASYIPYAFMWSKHYDGILSCLNAFSGAIFLTVGVLHLIPHVDEYEAMAKLDTDFPVGLSIIIIGFLLVLFVEQVLFDAHGHESRAPAPAGDVAASSGKALTAFQRMSSIARKYSSPLLTEAALILHAVLEAMVLGLTGSRSTVWLLFWAIASHKGFAAVSQATRFVRLGCPPLLLFALMAPYHVLPPLGVAIGIAVGEEDPTVGLVLTGLATGTFLYIGTFEVISEEFCDGSHSQSHDSRARTDVNSTTSPESSMHVSGKLESGAGAGNDAGAGSEGGSGEAKAAGWIPGRAVKFACLFVGCGLMFAITEALPAHDELHEGHDH